MTLSPAPRAQAPLSASYAVSLGSVTGKEHHRTQRGSQDGAAARSEDDLVVAVVTDGCSSGHATEVGARLGAAWIARLAARHFASDDPREAACAVTLELEGELARVALSLAPDVSERARVVNDYLLFTFLAAVLTREHAIVFGVGDGVVSVNGATEEIPAGKDNAPPYVAYALLGAAHASPKIHHLGAASSVRSIAVATDGAGALTLESGRLRDLEADLRYAKNPSLLKKWLAVRAGLLWDDTTIALVQAREMARPS